VELDICPGGSTEQLEAIRSGEQSGQMAMLLLNMADFLDEENEVVIKSLTSILEPVILIGLGSLGILRWRRNAVAGPESQERGIQANE